MINTNSMARDDLSDLILKNNITKQLVITVELRSRKEILHPPRFEIMFLVRLVLIDARRDESTENRNNLKQNSTTVRRSIIRHRQYYAEIF